MSTKFMVSRNYQMFVNSVTISTKMFVIIHIFFCDLLNIYEHFCRECNWIHKHLIISWYHGLCTHVVSNWKFTFLLLILQLYILQFYILQFYILQFYIMYLCLYLIFFRFEKTWVQSSRYQEITKCLWSLLHSIQKCS